jgi:formylglycine-generating enzyme
MKASRIAACLCAGAMFLLGAVVPPSTQPETNSLGMKFVLIPAGEFLMGYAPGEPGWAANEPQHKVRISKAFWFQATEVTQKQFAALIKGNNSAFSGDNQPVERVSWDEAVEYCRLLSVKEGKHYRLPTEAEWEYACRAGTTSPYNLGATISSDQANYDGTYVFGDGKKGVYRAKTVDVASFQPNAWGLYDMHGNVSEWCQDWENDYPMGDAVDPTGPAEGTHRISRGGAYLSEPTDCRSASRDWYVPDGQRDSRGFRVLMEVDTEAAK